MILFTISIATAAVLVSFNKRVNFLKFHKYILFYNSYIIYSIYVYI